MICIISAGSATASERGHCAGVGRAKLAGISAICGDSAVPGIVMVVQVKVRPSAARAAWNELCIDDRHRWGATVGARLVRKDLVPIVTSICMILLEHTLSNGGDGITPY